MAYARLTQVQVPADGIDAGIQSFKEDVVKTARSLEGYKGATLLIDRASGKGMGMTFWESEEARSKADATMNEARAQTLRAMGIDPESVPAPEMYEVAADDYNV